ncbi:MAG TPA: polynucleotide adenylyltransferase PcnB [Kofleriaceae bacterium]|jgi:poly(A) polymerase|nr:polynucleotide adenylyltransferase PcnB [Kofleriaceae bacterium]
MPKLDRSRIDPDADRVVRRLSRAGHKAYLVGGCVRDILLGRRPKDFDVATSATPNEIKAQFRNCRIIGRRFRLAHVFFGEKIIETSTFRANPRDDDDGDGELLIRRDNVFGNEVEDARRRDFTINGLFYDVEREEVIDHVGGLADLDARLIRTIGDPDIRFQEDPVRILRAIKFAARIGFDFEPATYRALIRHRGEIRKCPPPRVLEEVYRFLKGGAARRTYELLVETGVLDVLSPHLASLLEGEGAPVARPDVRAPAREPDDYDDDLDDEEEEWHRLWSTDEPSFGRGPGRTNLARDPKQLAESRRLCWSLLGQIDAWVGAGHEASNALVVAALLNPFVIESVIAPGSRPGDANSVILELGQPLIDQLHVPRRDAERARQILLFQRRVVPARRRRGRPEAVAGRDFFDDAVLLFELTERAAGRTPPDLDELKATSTHGDAEGGGEHAAAGASNDDDEPRKRRRRRRGGRRRRTENDAAVG